MTLTNLTCQTPTRFVRVAYLSLQPGGDVSFGLQDRAFISPKFKARQFVWSVFNRVTAEYEVSSDPSSLEKVVNPHFTFHPPVWFHLKSNKDKHRKDEQLFAGICDVGIVLRQQGRMPWLRAVTKPIRDYKSAGLKWSNVPTNDMPFNVFSEDVSVQIEVDFIPISEVKTEHELGRWTFKSGDFGVEFRAMITNPKIATLSWFHQY